MKIFSLYISSLCFMVSVLIHLLLGLVFSRGFLQNVEQPPIEVVFIEQNINRVIVSQEDFNDQIADKTSSYLSGGNKAVEKQTQAMMKGLFRQAKIEHISDKPPSLKRSLSSVKDPVRRSLVMNNPSIQFHVPRLRKKTLKKFSAVKRKTSEEHSQTPDFLLGVEEGSHTLLNTNTFAYYSYFNRMKEQVFGRWIRYFDNENLLDVTVHANNITGLFITEIIAFLSPEGELKDLMVVRSSGNETFDEAVLHAFMASAPFPNPPHELVEADNLIRINKTFYLHIIPSPSDSFFSKNTRR